MANKNPKVVNRNPQSNSDVLKLKNIKLVDLWVSEFNSNKSKVYKTKGFTVDFCDGSIFAEKEQKIMYFNFDGTLTYSKSDADVGIYNDFTEAHKHQIQRWKHWTEYYKKEMLRYEEMYNKHKSMVISVP